VFSSRPSQHSSAPTYFKAFQSAILGRRYFTKEQETYESRRSHHRRSFSSYEMLDAGTGAHPVSRPHLQTAGPLTVSALPLFRREQRAVHRPATHQWRHLGRLRVRCGSDRESFGSRREELDDRRLKWRRLGVVAVAEQTSSNPSRVFGGPKRDSWNCPLDLLLCSFRVE
jgi:hypothetical protein